MTAIRKCSVLKYGSYYNNPTPKDYVLTFSRVVSYESFASGAQTLIYYSNSSNTQTTPIFLNESYATFDTAYQQRTNDVGVPLFTISVDYNTKNGTVVFDSSDIVSAVLNPNGTTCTLLFTNPNGVSAKAVVSGDLDDIVAAAYEPSSGIQDGFMRSGSFASLNGATTVTFSSPLPAGTVIVQLSDLDGVNYENIVATSAGFTFDAGGIGDFTYIATLAN